MSFRNVDALKIAFLLGLTYLFIFWYPSRKSETITISELVSTLSQDDPRLVQYVRDHHLTPPSTKPYNLNNPNIDPGDWVGLTPILRRLLKNMVGIFCNKISQQSIQIVFF